MMKRKKYLYNNENPIAKSLLSVSFPNNAIFTRESRIISRQVYYVFIFSYIRIPPYLSTFVPVSRKIAHIFNVVVVVVRWIEIYSLTSRSFPLFATRAVFLINEKRRRFAVAFLINKDGRFILPTLSQHPHFHTRADFYLFIWLDRRNFQFSIWSLIIISIDPIDQHYLTNLTFTHI